MYANLRVKLHKRRGRPRTITAYEVRITPTHVHVGEDLNDGGSYAEEGKTHTFTRDEYESIIIDADF